MKEKNIPLKNYIILALVLILSIILVTYFYMWYSAYEESRLNTPIMDKYLTVINYNELENYLVENKDAVIYVSVLENEEIRKFEKKFKNIVNSYSLNNTILYLDLSSESKNSKIYNNVKAMYNFSELPCIMIFNNGKATEVYNIKDTGYDIDSLVTFFEYEGVISD